ncbi:uracil-DNA glycosylase [Thalassobaculum litoreum]|uniref:Type-5 uracil-DNA glycosylase n=1 Tax=Thalassobaculum litoreum DSM 18839 TaxID=1123362 RepID=A0A8G2BEA6_9PROT|nr:uracil-DNA glycosylase [Thalassobaculum litoreum]SDF15012.1 uracil-DNA glycosylase, family 4 [Thalassobaculum litoreum DSM 18839]
MLSDPPADCGLCPRLVAFRHENRRLYPEFHNAPVPSFGSAGARLLVVGMAPGLKGANRTGRPFTGDYAGDLLYDTLLTFGFATGAYDKRADDGLSLVDCRITNAVRCVPPQNKPVGAEVANCRPFLAETIAEMPALKVILVLGSLAHGATLAALGRKKSSAKFGHNAVHELGDGRRMVGSYHCSRYNTNTGRLTEEMFHDVFRRVRGLLDAG